MQKYGEIIYTRAGAAYDLKGHALPNNNGYAVFNISENLFDNSSDETVEFFRENALELYKYMRCPVDSFYAYIVAPNGEIALLGRYTPRTKEDAQAAAQARVDARASHLAQFLAGKFGKRPFEYIESPFFSAHKAPIADYYGRACQKRPEQMDDAPLGPVDAEEIARFVNDGRRDAVVACAAKLLEQNDGQPSAQKTIVIQDEEANARLWIAAILAALPLYIARDLSFCTSAMDLAEPGALVKKDRLVWRLAGAVPGDSSSVIPTPVPQSLPVLILDGKNKKAQFAADSAIMQSGMLARADSGGAFMQSFDELCKELKNPPRGAKVCELYDAAIAVNHLEELDYREMRKTLSSLLPYAMPNSALAARLENFLIASNGYRKNFADEDARNNLAMLNLLMSHAHSLGWQKNELVSLFVAAAENAIANPGCDQQFLDKIEGFFSSGNEIYNLARDRIIGENRLSCLDAARLEGYSPKQLQTLLRILAAHIRAHNGLSWKGLVKEGESVAALVDDCLQRDETALSLLELAKRNAADLAFLIGRGAKAGGQWPRLLARRANLPADVVCESLASNEAGPEDIDNYLAEIVNHKGLSQDILKLQARYLPGAKAGACLRAASIKFVEKTPLEQIAPIAREFLANLQTHPEDHAAALAALDAKVDFTPDGMSVASEINAHVKKGAQFCPRSGCLEFIEECKKGSSDKESPASRYLRIARAGQRLQAPAGFGKHGHGKKLLSHLADNADRPETSLLAAGAINFANAEEETEWLKAYAAELVKKFFKQGDGGLIAFCALKVGLERGSGANEKARQIGALWEDNMPRVHDNVAKIQQFCVDALSRSKNVKKDEKLPEDWRKDYGLEALAELSGLLKDAQEKYNNKPQGMLGKLFGGLFGK